jgi:hypothetical protein
MPAALSTAQDGGRVRLLGPLAPILAAAALSAVSGPVRAGEVTSGGTVEVLALDLARTPHRVSRAVRAFTPADARGGTLAVRLRGGPAENPARAGELLFDLRGGPLAGRDWGNRALVSADVRVSPELVGVGARNWQRTHRARLFLEDAGGRRLYLPSASIVDRPTATGGWLRLAGRPSVDVPVPLGFVDRGFQPARVTGLGLNVEAFNRPGELVTGTVELRDVRVAFAPPVVARVLPPDPAILAGEAERARRMQARLAERCGIGARGMAVGVNLAWPSAVAPDGTILQLFGQTLDAAAPWWDRRWDLGEPAVAASVRDDFHAIRAAFGPGAVVRVWLFGDLRAGIELDGAGNPVATSARARANMARLLALAVEQQVVLLPVLIDFNLADGVAAQGPDGAWKVNERPDLIVDATRRGRLVRVLEDFVRAFAGHPAILAWDVMNEPENAAAVVTPAHFADLQALVRELVDAVHRAGDLATVGHHDLGDPARFFHGRVATDLAQVHYYPLVETRPNPTSIAAPLAPGFGPLPGGWGEMEAVPGRIARTLAAARGAGHRLLLFWSWRGHEESGDGYAVQPHVAEIRRALAALRRR